MTVTEMIKRLKKIAEKHPRAPIYVEAEYFQSDDYSHGLVHSIETDWLPMVDGDGCGIENKDGSEHTRFVVILSGK